MTYRDTNTLSLERLQAALADRYRFERQLGQGGMATVYLAHDIRHDRPVAIKVLKPELAAVLGGERFVQEIRTTASLQHPHILPLFDSGTADGFLFYVMPYVEGETLRDKLNRETQLGLDEALRIATEVADALDYAHRHGVIHRDIKPENILLHDGRPVVADFGIALAVSAAAGGRMTETGLSLGTPHYMSPEQATADREITARSDIYSLASVLYEMLAGQPPHIGTSAQHIIMQIVTGEPRPVTEFRKSVPEPVADAVMQALEKLPADRFATAADFAAALRGQVAVRRIGTGPAAIAADRRWRRIAIGAVLLAGGLAGVSAWALFGRHASPRERVEFAYQANNSPTDRLVIRVSPDGRKVIQAVHDSNGVSHVVIRDLASTALTAVPGTENAGAPVLSPDGKTLAFVADMKLRTVPIAGGPSTILADSVMESAPAWSEDGRSLFFVHNLGALRRIPLSGGPPEVVTTIDTARREFAHWSPQVLPGGKAVVFNSFSAPFARSRIEAVELATGRRTVVLEGAMSPHFVPGGYLLFAREEGIFAVRFDPGALRVTGTPVPVLDNVAMSITDGEAAFDVSPGGTLAYIRASEWKRPMRVVWVDRSGAERPILPEPGPWAEPRLSPDSRWLALTRTEPRWQVWLYDLARGVLTHLSRTEGVSFNAVWTPDSRSLIHSVETPVYDLRYLPIDGTPARSLVSTPFDKKAGSVSPDGRTLVYLETESTSHLKFVPLAGGASSRVDPADVTQRNAVFSPDGRWLAYEEIGSNQAMQVWVRALREGGGRRQVSADGGSQPRWSRGGREIVYRKGGLMVAAGFDPATGEVGAPAPLFRKPEAGGLGASAPTVGFDVTPDGSRFVLIIPEERAGAQPNVVVLNWMEELRKTVLSAR